MDNNRHQEKSSTGYVKPCLSLIGQLGSLTTGGSGKKREGKKKKKNKKRRP